ncbi:TPA: uracil-DNA glycosylase [Candidatus Dependentiae bacterium]|nr:uracil-DNA glycosylase [Candidatus Dependentiae bacterium]
MQTKQELLNALYAPHRDFYTSPLYIEQSQNIVFGEGNPDAEIMLIGEAPGKNEELEGRPFVGQSGRLLNRALELCNLNRSEIYITNIVKCRPPNNRTPLPQELEIGRSVMLLEQITIIQPRIICTLGSIALRGLTQSIYQITKIHGQPIDFNGIILLPTFHPAFILRNKSRAPQFLADIEKLRKL